MGDITEVKREVVEYWVKCKSCSKDFQLYSGVDKQRECYACKNKREQEERDEEVEFFLHAKVVGWKTGHWPSQFHTLTVETTNGIQILLTPGGFDEPYIEWRPLID